MDNKMTETNAPELKPPPYVAPRFGVGDIVTTSDECPYRHDYRGIYLIVAEVCFDPRREKLTYSTLPWPIIDNEGMTTDWPETDLSLHTRNRWNTRPSAPVAVEGLSEAIAEAESWKSRMPSGGGELLYTAKAVSFHKLLKAARAYQALCGKDGE